MAYVNKSWISQQFESFAEKVSNVFAKKSSLSNYLEKDGDASEAVVTFLQATERANVQPGDDLAVAFSKLSKYCADLKPHAFNALTDNLLATVSGVSALDATQGKVLKDGQNIINPLKMVQANVNLDDYDWVTSERPYVFGHSTTLANIGIGYWCTIQIQRLDTTHIYLKAIGSTNREAHRIGETGQNGLVWSDWVLDATQSQIDAINSDLCAIRDASIYNSFSEIPSLPMENYYVSFTFCVVRNTTEDPDAPVRTQNIGWWNVLSFGNDYRLTRVAFSVYGDRANIYWMQKHDDHLYGWYTISGEPANNL